MRFAAVLPMGPGLVLATFGLIADIVAGLLTLDYRFAQALVLHSLAIGAWAVGVELMARTSEHTDSSQDHSQSESAVGQPYYLSMLGFRVVVHRVTVLTATLSLFLFPGIGLLGFGVGSLLGSLLRWQRQGGDMNEADNVDTRQNRISGATQNLFEILEVRPLADVLHSSDGPLKRAAIEMLSRRPGPHSAILLQKALADRDADVRTWAAVGMARIEDHFNQLLHEARSLAETSATPAPHLARVGHLFSELADCHPSDEASQRFYLVQAIGAVQRALAIDSGSQELWLALLRYQVHVHDAPGAWDTFEQVQKRFPSQVETYLLGMELAFNQGRFDKVAELARSCPTVPNPHSAASLVQWWGHQKAAAAGAA